MIEVWKIMKGKENVNRASLFTLNANEVTRNNGYKIVGKRFSLDITRNFSTYRVVEEWNKLPAEVVNSDTIETFKSRLDKFYQNRR